MVGDDQFDRTLGSSIWICWANWTVFWDGNHTLVFTRIAVDGCGRGEDDVWDVVLGHASEEGDCPADIDAVVFQWDFGGFANGLGLWCQLGNLKRWRRGTLRAAKWITLSTLGCAAKTLSNASSSVMSTLWNVGRFPQSNWMRSREVSLAL